jgi:hypothetical protein
MTIEAWIAFLIAGLVLVRAAYVFLARGRATGLWR